MLKHRASDKTAEKILSFEMLPTGWYFGEGVPPSPKAIEFAIKINEKAALLQLQTDAFPGQNGEVQISVYSCDDYLEFIIDAEGLITFVYEKNDQEQEYLENLTLEEAIHELTQDRNGECHGLLGSSTQNTLTIIKKGFLAWPLEILQTTGFLFLNWNAQRSKEDHFVNISTPSTQTQSLVTLQSSGSYLKMSCQSA